jgi:hypothetical protein
MAARRGASELCGNGAYAGGWCEDDFGVHDRPETSDFLTASLENSCPLVQTYIRLQVAVQNAVSLAHSAGDHATPVTF